MRSGCAMCVCAVLYSISRLGMLSKADKHARVGTPAREYTGSYERRWDIMENAIFVVVMNFLYWQVIYQHSAPRKRCGSDAIHVVQMLCIVCSFDRM